MASKEEWTVWMPNVAPRAGVARRLIAPDGHPYSLTMVRPTTPPPPRGFPLILVLDGASHFPIVAGAVNALGRRTAKTGVPNAVVIGLAQDAGAEVEDARRAHDFTDGPPEPPHTVPHPNGGADALLAFIAETVLPVVQASAPVDPARTALFSHSLGALFGLHVMTRRPELFSAWGLVSPSLWWRPGLARRAAAAVADKASTVHLAWGEREGIGGDPRGMVANSAEAFEVFQAALGAQRVSGGMLADEDHGSAPITACAAILRSFGRAWA